MKCRGREDNCDPLISSASLQVKINICKQRNESSEAEPISQSLKVAANGTSD